MQIRVCNGCDWVGWEDETVCPKHAESVRLCPECRETTEVVTPQWFKDLRGALRRAAQSIHPICVNCGEFTCEEFISHYREKGLYDG